MIICALPSLFRRLITWIANVFYGKDRLRYYQVSVANNRNYLGANRYLLELHFRARDPEEASAMLERFRQKFYHPAYTAPYEMGWFGKLFFLRAPRTCNVKWRELCPNGQHRFRECNIIDLDQT